MNQTLAIMSFSLLSRWFAKHYLDISHRQTSRGNKYKENAWSHMQCISAAIH